MTSGEIQIADIERELMRLWRDTVKESAAAGGGAAVMRATAMNLIVAGCGSERQGLSEVLQEVAQRHPCRAILIESDESRAEARAWVNMLCHRGGRGQPQICSENVVLSGPSSTLHEMFGSIAGLLATDVPTFVWWRARLPENAAEQDRFDHIARLASRFLFDSALCAGGQLGRIAAFVAARRVPAVGDVNWSRLMHWRAHVARIFDPPAARELLGRLESALIRHQGTQPDAGTRLMAGWLRSRLDSLQIEFVPAAAASIELRAGGQLFTVPCPALPSEAEALSAELLVLGRDEVFEQALAALAGIE